MRHMLLSWGFLIFMVLVPVTQAGTQSTDETFDYDQALAASQAAVGNRLDAHRFTDVDGKAVRLDQFRGKPLVLSMVYTSCYQICPMTTRHLSKVVEKARAALGDDSFTVAVVGFDSAIDTPDAMLYFANKQGIYGKNWQLLSADAHTVAALSRDLGFLYYPSSNGFDHLIQATIIDADGKVYRQVYGQVFDTPLLDNLVNRIKLFCTTYDPARDGYYYDYSLFVGMFIGATIIGFAGTVVVRGFRQSRRSN